MQVVTCTFSRGRVASRRYHGLNSVATRQQVWQCLLPDTAMRTDAGTPSSASPQAPAQVPPIPQRIHFPRAGHGPRGWGQRPPGASSCTQRDRVMFEDLNAALNYEPGAPPTRGLTLIKCAAPTGEGSLLLHHYVSLYLQAGHAVCLCGFEQVPEPRARIAVRQSAGGAVCARHTHTHTRDLPRAQDLAHYTAVAKRMGVNLATEAKAVCCCPSVARAQVACPCALSSVHALALHCVLSSVCEKNGALVSWPGRPASCVSAPFFKRSNKCCIA